ncbi:MAG TPA: hypothetical protein VFX20_02890 [Steroidobacteraceae bacterium]|nr:hypothetical protein [Steroidobacteraceae bacterium]
MRALLAAVLAVSLAACGGSGSGSGSAGDPAPPPPPSPSSMQLGTTQFSVSAYAQNLAPQPVSVPVTIIQAPATEFSYRVSTSGTAVSNASFSWQSSASGTVTVSFPSPGTLGPGTYQGSVQISICQDAACTQPIGGSPATIDVTYVVNAGAQPSASFTVQQGPAAITSPLFTSQTTAILADFSFYVTDFPSSGLWLQITQPVNGLVTSAAFQPFGGPTAVIGLTLKSPAALGPGLYNTSVSFTLCYDSACADPVPGSPVTEPLVFTVSATAGREFTSQSISLPGVSALAWDATQQQLYATTGAGGTPADSLVQLDPATGTVGSALAFPVALTELAVSDDGQYAYVSSRDQPTIYRVALPSMTSDLQIALGSSSIGGSSSLGPNTVYQMRVAPGAAQTLAVSLDVSGGTAYSTGVAIFDGATERANVLPPLNSLGGPASIAWGDSASTLYALRTAPATPSYLSELDTVSVAANGLSVAGAYPLSPSDPVTHIFYAAGRLYGFDGVVRDAGSGATLGTLSIPSGYQVITLMPDPGNSRVIFLTHELESEHLVLFCFDASTFAMTSVADLGYDESPGHPLNMVLWGTNGIAFDYGSNSVMVLSGSFTAAP